MIARRFLRAVTILVVALVPSACESLFGTPATYACADVALLPEARQAVTFNGKGRDLIDVNFGAQFIDVAGTCEYEVHKEDGSAKMFLDVGMAFLVERGPANQDRNATLSYFVSVIDPDRKPVAKEVFNLEVEFEGNVTKTTLRPDPVPVTIPVAKPEDGQHYQVLIGFQLTREQLDYNRALSERATPGNS